MKSRVLDFMKGFKKKHFKPAHTLREPQVLIRVELPKEDLETLQLAAQIEDASVGEIIRRAVKRHTSDPDS